MPTIDEFAVLSDGSLAFVRGRDYHIDWIDPAGAATSSSKIPFDWQRLTDEDKIAVVDSARAAAEKARAMGAGAAGAAGAAAMGQRSTVVMSVGGTIGGDGPARTTTTMSAGSASAPSFISPSELPDYRPPFNAGAARADRDGNLWVRTTAVRSTGVVGVIYDVINTKGELTERIQIPSGREIIGFGPGGVIYMRASDERGAWIERAKKG
jgi:hypothetical protein